MINAYRDTSSAIEVERRRVENEVVTALAGGIDVGAARLEQWVRALDLDPGGVWIAAAVRSTERSSLTALQVSLRRRAAGLGGSGISHVLFGETDRVLLILVSVAGDEDRARDAVRTLFSGARPGGPVLGGVGDPCRTLGEAGSSCRQAQDAMRVARSADPGDPVTLVDHRDVLVDVLVDAHPGAADALTRAVLDPLARYPYLVETLEVLLAHHLSQSVTARELFLHVNTVSHRLHRIHQLTGRHPTRFPDAVEIALALRWRRLRTGPDDGGTATGGPGS
nr:helix-turn-helix domain-containing protein [Nakamurella flavida]